MCDIYFARCEGCGKKIMMHLGDFLTHQDEIKVYCSKCILNGKIPVEYSGKTVFWYGIPLHRKTPTMVAVVSLTENAWEHRFINYPNYYPLQPFTPLKKLYI